MARRGRPGPRKKKVWTLLLPEDNPADPNEPSVAWLQTEAEHEGRTVAAMVRQLLGEARRTRRGEGPR